MGVSNKYKVLVALSIVAALTSVTVRAFDAGEHSIIGDIAFERTFPDRNNEVSSLELKTTYRYGHLVALSGDMYKSIEEISLADPIVVDGYFGRNRDGLKKCIDKEIYSIQNEKLYGGCGDLKIIEKKTRYIVLAHDNYSHFAWHNLKTYVKYHEKALWFAVLAHNKCTKEQWTLQKDKCEEKKQLNRRIISESNYKKRLSVKHRRVPKLFPRRKLTKDYLDKMSKEKMIDLAFFANAYADHFLTDSFSAGHLRVPRSEIDGFVKRYEKDKAVKDIVSSLSKRKKGSSISGALTQYLHHLDGALTGLPVKNSLGDRFVIRGDKQLFSVDGDVQLSGIVNKHPNVQQPVEAVSKSLSEVDRVIRNGQTALPKSTYAALLHVPFIEDRSNTLKSVVDKDVQHHGSIKKTIASMSTEMHLVFRARVKTKKLSDKQYFADFVEAIPLMMKEFRKKIQEDLRDETLQLRIPKQLMDAMRNIE